MGRKIKYSIEQKLQAVYDYLDSNRGMVQICHELSISKSG